MIAPLLDLPAALADAVGAYEASGNVGALMERLHTLRATVTPDALVAAAEPWLHMPEVAGPLYERVVDEQPTNARALVILANAYWLSGRGPEVVGEVVQPSLRCRRHGDRRRLCVRQRVPASLLYHAASVRSLQHAGQWTTARRPFPTESHNVLEQGDQVPVPVRLARRPGRGRSGGRQVQG